MLSITGLILCFITFVAASFLQLSLENNEISDEDVGAYELESSVERSGFENDTILHSPYQAAIIYDNQVVAPGVIIDKKYIISSALLNIIWKDHLIKVAVGRSSVENPTHYYQVEKVIYNDNFSLGTEYNVALLKLKKPIKFSKSVKKISISSSPGKNGTTAKTLTWSRTKHDETSPHYLLKTNVLVLSQEFCEQYYIASVVSSTSLCAFRNDIKLEVVDGGAPLVQKNKLIGFFQGIPAVLPICTDIAWCPFIYTDVSVVKKWVDTIIKSRET